MTQVNGKMTLKVKKTARKKSVVPNKVVHVNGSTSKEEVTEEVTDFGGMRTKYVEVYYSDIGIMPTQNIRTDVGDIEALSESIEAVGLKIPLVIREAIPNDNVETEYVLVDGHRRHAALAKVYARKYESFNNDNDGDDSKYDPELKCRLVEYDTNYNSNDFINLLVYNEGKPLSMYEEATILKKLFNLKFSGSKLAKLTGKSLPHIMNCLLLMDATGDVLKRVEDGQVSASFVVNMLKEMPADKVSEQLTNTLEKTGKGKVAPKDVSGESARELKVRQTTFYTLDRLRELLLSEIKDKPINKDAFEVLAGLMDFINKDLDYDAFVQLFVNKVSK